MDCAYESYVEELRRREALRNNGLLRGGTGERREVLLANWAFVNDGGGGGGLPCVVPCNDVQNLSASPP